MVRRRTGVEMGSSRAELGLRGKGRVLVGRQPGE